jgi:Ca2+-binding EF-hand superfamily protein
MCPAAAVTHNGSGLTNALTEPEGIMSSAADLRDRNIRAIFDLLDANSDGVITASDLSSLAARACDQLGITGTAKGEQIADIYASWWEQLAADADADADGRITRDEFAAAHVSGDGDPAAYYQQQVGRIVAAEAEALDADGDGYIGQAEYAALLAVAGVTTEIALAGFARLDTDHDGKISTDEFAAGIAQLVLSQDPADHGTAILGET